MTDNAGGNGPAAFSAMYGKVVFAKVGTYPWWPALVCDPTDKSLDMKKPIRDKAKKGVGKTYVIYNYGDGNYGFCDKKQIQLFSTESLENVRVANKTKLKGVYVESFERGVTEATQECAVPENQRAAAMRKYIIEIPLPPSPPPANAPSPAQSHEEDTKVTTVSMKKSKGSETKRRRAKEEEGVDEGERMKRHTTRDDATKLTTKKEGKSAAAAAAAAAAVDAEVRRSVFKQESRTDRLARLKATLIQTTTIQTTSATGGATSDTFDETRALKIIRKLGELHLTLEEIKACAFGKLIAELRNHVSEEISSECKKLRKRWIEERAPTQVAVAGVATGTESNGTGIVGQQREQQKQEQQEQEQQLQRQNKYRQQLSPDRKVSVLMLKDCLASFDLAFALEEILHSMATITSKTSEEQTAISSSTTASFTVCESVQDSLAQPSLYYETITRLSAILSQAQSQSPNPGSSKMKERLSILLTQYMEQMSKEPINSSSSSTNIKSDSSLSSAIGKTTVIDFLRNGFSFLNFSPTSAV